MTETNELNAAISCMGYGYEVKVLINGTDIGITGGKSQSMRLFNTDHPMKVEAEPEMQKRLFILKKGENNISVEFRKTGESEDRLSCEVSMLGDIRPFLTFQSVDGEGHFEDTFTL